jgi:uncharacterized protein (TIGR00255 family)
MTGFGVGDAPLGQGGVSVEVRCLDHRYLETRVRLPTELADHTFYVEQRCRDSLKRGRCDVTVRLEGAALPPPAFDVARAKSAYAALEQLRDEVLPGAEVPLSLLAGLPDLFSRDTLRDPGVIRAALDAALEHAVIRLDRMRDTEGKALAADLTQRLGAARSLRQQIAGVYPTVVARLRKKLQERLQRLLDELPLHPEPGRLEAEVVLLAERSDVSEELARLESHFDHFEALCATETVVGRRLDFLLQEISRETNTLGAKCQDAQLSHLVVELKAETERMREQVQNVE